MASTSFASLREAVSFVNEWRAKHGGAIRPDDLKGDGRIAEAVRMVQQHKAAKPPVSSAPTVVAPAVSLAPQLAINAQPGAAPSKSSSDVLSRIRAMTQAPLQPVPAAANASLMMARVTGVHRLREEQYEEEVKQKAGAKRAQEAALSAAGHPVMQSVVSTVVPFSTDEEDAQASSNLPSAATAGDATSSFTQESAAHRLPLSSSHPFADSTMISPGPQHRAGRTAGGKRVTSTIGTHSSAHPLPSSTPAVLTGHSEGGLEVSKTEAMECYLNDVFASRIRDSELSISMSAPAAAPKAIPVDPLDVCMSAYENLHGSSGISGTLQTTYTAPKGGARVTTQTALKKSVETSLLTTGSYMGVSANGKPLCSGHKMESVLRKVKKAGPNKGRYFYACPCDRSLQCPFFLWKDEDARKAAEDFLRSCDTSGSGSIESVVAGVERSVRRISLKRWNDRILTVKALKEECGIRGIGLSNGPAWTQDAKQVALALEYSELLQAKRRNGKPKKNVSITAAQASTKGPTTSAGTAAKATVAVNAGRKRRNLTGKKHVLPPKRKRTCTRVSDESSSSSSSESDDCSHHQDSDDSSLDIVTETPGEEKKEEARRGEESDSDSSSSDSSSSDSDSDSDSAASSSSSARSVVVAAVTRKSSPVKEAKTILETNSRSTLRIGGMKRHQLVALLVHDDVARYHITRNRSLRRSSGGEERSGEERGEERKSMKDAMDPNDPEFVTCIHEALVQVFRHPGFRGESLSADINSLSLVRKGEERRGGEGISSTPGTHTIVYNGPGVSMPMQEWAVRRCLAGKSSVIVAATGTGKSLLYQLPAYLLRQGIYAPSGRDGGVVMDGTGITVVISPLISLIQDQMKKLPPGVLAANITSTYSHILPCYCY
jgi:hypothetical protein